MTTTDYEGEIDRIFDFYDAFFVSEQAMNNGRGLAKTKLLALLDRAIKENYEKNEKGVLHTFIDEIGEYGMVLGERSEVVASWVAYTPLVRTCKRLNISFADVYDSLPDKYKRELNTAHLPEKAEEGKQS